MSTFIFRYIGDGKEETAIIKGDWKAGYLFYESLNNHHFKEIHVEEITDADVKNQS